MGAKANKHRFRRQTSCILLGPLGLECRYVLMRNEGDVMVNFEPGEYIKKITFHAIIDTGDG